MCLGTLIGEALSIKGQNFIFFLLSSLLQIGSIYLASEYIDSFLVVCICLGILVPLGIGIAVRIWKLCKIELNSDEGCVEK
jgi:hypothetical protein